MAPALAQAPAAGADANWSTEFDLHGLNGTVEAIVSDASGNVFVGGSFTEAGSVAASRIAQWNGDGWSPLGEGFDATVRALAIDSEGNLCAGGDFTASGRSTLHRLACWDGTSWAIVGEGLPSQTRSVTALAIDPMGNLFVGGWGPFWWGYIVGRVMRWNGTDWTALYTGDPQYPDGLPRALGSDAHGAVFVSLTTSVRRLIPPGYWNAVASGVVNEIIHSPDGKLIVAGQFTYVASYPAQNIALWDGEYWSTLGEGVASEVRALAFDEAGNLYAAGGPDGAAMERRPQHSYLQRWDGGQWETLDTIGGTVRALSVQGTSLWVGGTFQTAGGIPSHNIARWDGIPPVSTEPGNADEADMDVAWYPNPASSETTITFSVSQPGLARIEAFDVLGRRVAVVLDEVVDAGSYERRFDASALPSGVYVLRVSAGGLVKTTRVMVAR